MDDNIPATSAEGQTSDSNVDFFYQEIHPASWNDARSLSQKLVGWIFRGHADTRWSLSTTLERSAVRQGCLPAFIPQRERWILRDFKRRGHHYLVNPPADQELLEWLSIIQHHGGPTRLLDFTRSFYVAAFFAVEQAQSDAAIWAINLEKLHRRIVKKANLELDARTPIDVRNIYHVRACNLMIGKEVPTGLVVDVEPERLNERLAAQQGMFLFPSNVQQSFMVNLAGTFDMTVNTFSVATPKTFDRGISFGSEVMLGSVMKIMLPRGSHKAVLDDLSQMNITAATLFPGLDGFARSLHHHLNVFQQDDDFYKRFST